MIKKLRNAVVAPTGMGKNHGRIMPLLRQGWLVRQKIMHYGFLDNASQDAFARGWAFCEEDFQKI